MKKICPVMSGNNCLTECRYEECEFFDEEFSGCLFKQMVTNLEILVEQNES